MGLRCFPIDVLHPSQPRCRRDLQRNSRYRTFSTQEPILTPKKRICGDPNNTDIHVSNGSRYVTLKLTAELDIATRF